MYHSNVILFLFCLLAVKPKGRAPSFVSELRPKTAIEDDSFKLVCKISGEPKPTVTWYKNDKEIPLDDRITTTFDGLASTLAFKNTALNDAGNYKCKIENEFGSVDCSADISVEKKKTRPEVIDKMKDVNTTEDNEARFEVRISGYPAPEVDWYRRKNRIEDDEKFSIDTSGDVFALNIKDISLDDAGYYRCVARNEAGETDAQAKLIVAEKQFAPEFEGEVESPLSLQENDDFKVEFKINGKPKPEVLWFKDGARLHDSLKVNVSSRGGSSKLSIPNIKPNDAGTYRCEARNDVGSSSKSFDVIVEGDIFHILDYHEHDFQY